jgi:hypothetical protein
VLDMMANTIALFTLLDATNEAPGKAREAVVPEPEFKRFKFPKRDGVAVRAAAIAPVNTTREARTLAELGVPAPLARELEATLRAMGMTKGEKVTGFTFRTPDGAAHALKTAETRAAAADDLAA